MAGWWWRHKVENELRKLVAMTSDGGFRSGFKMQSLSAICDRCQPAAEALKAASDGEASAADAAVFVLLAVIRSGAEAAVANSDGAELTRQQEWVTRVHQRVAGNSWYKLAGDMAELYRMNLLKLTVTGGQPKTG